MKNNKYLKFLSTILVAILIITIAPINDSVASEMKSSANSIVKTIGEAVGNIDFNFAPKAEAAKNSCDYYWSWQTATLTFVGIGEIPAYTKGNAPWSQYKNARRVIISDQLTCIGANAFNGFTQLETVVIESPVTYIGSRAFCDCTSLKSINLPDTLESISSYAFENCISFKEFVIPRSVTSVSMGVLSGCNIEKLTAPFVGGGPDNTASNKTDQLGHMFGVTEKDNTYTVKARYDSKKNYYIPYSLKSVTITKNLYKYNFYNCTGIEEIIIADTVTSTGYANYFAYGCTALKKVVTSTKKFNNGVGAAAFQKCSALESFIIPDSIKWIGEDAFNECTSLSSVTVPSGDFYIRLRAFDNTPFWEKQTDEFVIMGDGVLVRYNGTDTNVVIPEGVKRICCAFENRSDILSIQLSADLKYISSDSFYGCLGITELVVPDSVIEIDEEAFDGMCNLERLTIPFIGKNRDVKTDTEEALIGFWFDETTNKTCNTCKSEYCVKRTQYYKSNKYTRIFYQPKKLKTLVITDSIIRSWCLKNFFIDNLTIGASVDGLEESAFYNAGIDNLCFDPLCTIEEIPDFAFSKNSIKEVVLPASIKKIGRAFTINPITSITLNEGLEEIDGTFEGMEITSVELPSTLEKINGSAFAKCSKLSEIYIPENVEEISKKAFVDSYFEYIYVDDKNENFFDEDGVLYDKDGVLIAYPSGSTANTFFISDRVTLIPLEAQSEFVNIERFVVDENNKHYFSCDGVLYSSAGNLVEYPNKKTDTTYVICDRVKGIPNRTNDYISHIVAVEVSENNPLYKSIDGVLYNKDVTEIIWYPQKKVGDYTAPDTVRNVRKYAFCKAKLGKLEFPNEVEFEQDSLYQADMEELIAVNFERGLYNYFGYEYWINQVYNPKSLKRLVLTNQTSNIPKDFVNSFRFDEIEINGTFTQINENAFWSVEGCREITLPDTVECIGKAVFKYADFRKIYCGKSLKRIEAEGFFQAFIYDGVELPETLEYIGDGAFAHSHIREINLGDNITHIGRSAFRCSDLKKAVISESLAGMSDEIFYECDYLETIVIGGGIESIGEVAFAGCPALEAVIIPSNVVEISDDAFLESNEDVVIYCNEGSYAESYAVKNNIKYTTLVIDPIENQTYTGREIKPEIKVSANNRVLNGNTEYTISYKDNIDVGSAKAIVKGLGDFKHLAATAKFTILPKSAEGVRVLSGSSTYKPNGVKPKVYAFSDVETLVEGQDFEILNNPLLKGAGEYNIAVSFIGNYYGVTNVTYTVSRRSISSTDIEYGDTIKITFRGETLKEGRDYTVTKEIDENGDIVTTIKGMGNYKGTYSYIQEGDNQSILSWFENLFASIKRMFERLFNIGI